MKNSLKLEVGGLKFEVGFGLKILSIELQTSNLISSAKPTSNFKLQTLTT